METASIPLKAPVETTANPVPAAAATPMRALLQSRYGGTETLRAGSTERPSPQSGQVLVRVHAAGIDRGTWHLMTGRPYLMRLAGFGFFAPKNPVLGRDLAGTVVAVGPNVTRFKVGDAVFGTGEGSFAEYTCADQDKLARPPRGWSFEDAAVLGISGSTALLALEHAKVEAGERVLVVGASGGVGTYAVQLAKARGAHVTAVASGSKLDLLRELGADAVIDYGTTDFADGATRYDAILDLGGNTPLGRLRRAMTDSARLVFVGGEKGGDFSAGFERQLLAFALAPFVSQRFVMLMNEEHHSVLERLVPYCEAGQLRPVIDRRVTLDEVPAAIEALAAGRVRGKLVVQLAGN
jgi:NADPH:quinone reductase-like Zn-dependent oxidoreductase